LFKAFDTSLTTKHTQFSLLAGISTMNHNSNIWRERQGYWTIKTL
jgi:hypothetical protein